MNAVKGKGGKIWPWIVGAGVTIGGVKWVKDHKVNVRHKTATPISREKTAL